jgi:hypothetical protein
VQRLAPELPGVTKRRPSEWLLRWLTNPLQMQAEDPEAMKLLAQWNNLSMPNVGLSEEQATFILEFLASRDAPDKGRGRKAPPAPSR